MYQKVVKENPKIRSLNLQFTTFMIQGKIFDEVSESWSLLKFPQRERERERERERLPFLWSSKVGKTL
jgi:hypothetical protein